MINAKTESGKVGKWAGESRSSPPDPTCSLSHLPTCGPSPVSPADLSVGFTSLIAAFEQALPNRSLLETQVALMTGTRASVFTALGWLKEEPSGRYGKQYFPAGALLDALTGTAGSRPHTDPPNSEGAGTGEAETELPQLAGAVPVPAAPALSPSRATLHRIPAGITKELADAIGALREVSDCTRKHLIEIAVAQEMEHGWNDYNEVRNATAHLRRLASELYNHLGDYECQLGIVEMNLRRNNQPKLKHA